MQTRVMGWQNLELLKVDSIDEIPNTYRHRMASYHRVDLHSGLRRLAEQNSAVRIKLGTTVAELDCNTGKLGFADGSCVQKDLIVIADGINVSPIFNINLALHFSISRTALWGALYLELQSF
jgi:salicylate hydroxylase